MNEIASLIERRELGTLEALRQSAYEREGDPLLAALTDQNAQLESAKAVQIVECEANTCVVSLEEVRRAKKADGIQIATIEARISQLRGILTVISDNIFAAPYKMLRPGIVHNPSKAQYMAQEMDAKMTAAVSANRTYKRKSFLHTAMKIAEVAAEEYDRDPLNPQPDDALRDERRTFR